MDVGLLGQSPSHFVMSTLPALNSVTLTTVKVVDAVRVAAVELVATTHVTSNIALKTTKYFFTLFIFFKTIFLSTGLYIDLLNAIYEKK